MSIISLDAARKKKEEQSEVPEFKDESLIGGDYHNYVTGVMDAILETFDFYYKSGKIDQYVNDITDVEIPNIPWSKSLDSTKKLMDAVGLTEYSVSSGELYKLSGGTHSGWICGFLLHEECRSLAAEDNDWGSPFLTPSCGSELEAKLQAVVVFCELKKCVQYIIDHRAS